MPKKIIIEFSDDDADELIELLRDLLDRTNCGSYDDQDGPEGDQDNQ